MNEVTNKRTRLLQARLTQEEYQRIYNTFLRTTCRKLSDYIRNVLLGNPIKIHQRNQSLDDFMAEMGKLREELNAIANNYNEAVKRLHILKDLPEIKTWLLLNENSKKLVLQKVSEIKLKIDQFNDQWLQS